MCHGWYSTTLVCAFENELWVRPYSICLGAEAHEAKEKGVMLEERVFATSVMKDSLYFFRDGAAC